MTGKEIKIKKKKSSSVLQYIFKYLLEVIYKKNTIQNRLLDNRTSHRYIGGVIFNC